MFFLPSVRHPATGAASGFSVHSLAAGQVLPRCFFRPITLAAARKNLQEMHFKTEGTDAAAYIRTGQSHEAVTAWRRKSGTIRPI